VDAVQGPGGFEAVLAVVQGGVVVDVGQALIAGVGRQPGVDGADAFNGLQGWAPGEFGGRRDRREDHADVVGLGLFDHGADVVLDPGDGGRAGVAGDVVGAGHDLHHAGVQVDHILAVANQHLGCGLAADAAIQHLAREEGRILNLPQFGDGVAE